MVYLPITCLIIEATHKTNLQLLYPRLQLSGGDFFKSFLRNVNRGNGGL